MHMHDVKSLPACLRPAGLQSVTDRPSSVVIINRDCMDWLILQKIGLVMKSITTLLPFGVHTDLKMLSAGLRDM